jgi:hypothetical protein
VTIELYNNLVVKVSFLFRIYLTAEFQYSLQYSADRTLIKISDNLPQNISVCYLRIMVFFVDVYLC